MSNNLFLMNAQTGKLHEFGKLVLPETKTVNNIPWVIDGVDPDWYNQQPQYYEYLKRTSAKNGAIIKAKNRYVYGRGWEVENPTTLSTEEIINLRSFIAKIEKLKVTPKNISDRSTQGGFACEMIPSKDMKTWMPHYLPFQYVRVGKQEYGADKKELPLKYYYTKAFGDKSQNNKKKEAKDFVTFETFTWDKATLKKGVRYIVYYKDSDCDDLVYPMPEYMAGVPYIEADAEVGNFVKNNVKNGFTAGLLVNFFDGVPDEDQQAEIQEQWRKAKHGTDNAGDAILAFNETGSEGVKVEQINPNGQDDRYVNLNNQIRDEIFTAHTTSPLVVGMKGDNGFSNNADEKRTAVEDFTENYVKPIQEIFNEFMNNVIQLNGLRGKIALKRLPMMKPKIEMAKLFEVASRTEIRSIYREMGFDLKEVEDTAEPVQQTLKELNLKFSKEETSALIQAFSECGTEDINFRCFDKKELHAKDVFDAFKQANTFKQEFASKIESAVLKIVAGDPDLTVKEISELLKDTPKNIQDILDKLEVDGLIENGNITEEGKQEIEENQIFVVYKYALRPDALPLKGGESREFCQEMMKLSQTRSWTIEDIQNISNRVGYDVFARRGGWYTIPDTEKHLPYCRHFWQQRLVRRK